ncbi:MAG: cysteine--tRNA ligase [Gammaproteobacteria bacterium]|nr:MAG: cysteine--tRNA ligase [Gammaproteobacteria bacterium]
MLQIYNSLSRKKQPLKPIREGKVGMYVCGMTVYDYCHLGHARVLVAFDIVTRYLRFSGYEVDYVRNITDIDDKIINRANERSVDINGLTEEFIQAMHEDAEALGVLPPDREPRATQHIGEIIVMIQSLQDRGLAYVAGNNDVYYDVSQFADYGKLSGKQTEDLRAGARVEIERAKEDPLDFVLWKAAKPDEPAWPSPWGPGRPGWHIECSAMSTHCLGNHFDIHGGGMDLQFPHHENEIAQSEGATGETFVNIWMHNGFVRVDDEKMSKSLGNFFTIREILQRYDPEVVRYFILNSHYRSPLHYSDQHLDTARSALSTLYTALRKSGIPDGTTVDDVAHGNNTIQQGDYHDRFRQAMDDDFNTAGAIAVLFDLAHHINRVDSGDTEALQRLGACLRRLGGILGLLQRPPQHFLQGSTTATGGLSSARIEEMIELRQQARRNQDWAEADRLRDELLEHGITLEDNAGDTLWRRE